ncbi:ABC transporter ATP-binding protein [Mycoplasma marinum]|uniref:ATP-binding cassette domain-containing protein n=1 Tax=Mycoplasma marinum TaxID=1937190 RepID=UPI003B31299E
MPKISKINSILLYALFFITQILILINLYLFTYMFKSLKEANMEKFIMWVCIGIVSSLITYFLCYSRDVFLAKKCERLKAEYRTYIFNSHNSRAGQRIILNKPGSFKSVTIENVEAYVSQFIQVKYSMLGLASGFFAALTIMAYYSWEVALSAASLTILCFIITLLINKKLSQNRVNFLNTINEQDDMFSEMLDLRSIFYLNGASMKLARMFSKKYKTTQNRLIKVFLKYTLYYIPAMFTGRVTIFIIVSISGILVIYGSMPIELLASIVFVASNFVTNAEMLTTSIFWIFSSKNLNGKFSPPKCQDSIGIKDKKISILEKISYQNYNISFKEKELFKEKFNFEFTRGGKYAIVGESGSGKSTLINSLIGKNFGFSGDIKINENKLRDYKLETLIKNIGILNSTPYIFNATLFENITMFDEGVPDEKVQEILEKINFHDLELHKKVNLKSISEGQKQKINLARVIYKKPDWIISDEGFSNMDSNSRKNAVNYIIDEFEGGVINITHHLKKDEEVKYDEKISL